MTAQRLRSWNEIVLVVSVLVVRITATWFCSVCRNTVKMFVRFSQLLPAGDHYGLFCIRRAAICCIAFMHFPRGLRETKRKRTFDARSLLEKTRTQSYMNIVMWLPFLNLLFVPSSTCLARISFRLV